MYKVKYGKNHEFYKNLGIVGEGYTYEDALLDAIAFCNANGFIMSNVLFEIETDKLFNLQALINTYGN